MSKPVSKHERRLLYNNSSEFTESYSTLKINCEHEGKKCIRKRDTYQTLLWSPVHPIEKGGKSFYANFFYANKNIIENWTRKSSLNYFPLDLENLILEYNFRSIDNKKFNSLYNGILSGKVPKILYFIITLYRDITRLNIPIDRYIFIKEIFNIFGYPFREEIYDESQENYRSLFIEKKVNILK